MIKPKSKSESKKINRRSRRNIEVSLGVFLDEPKTNAQCANEHIGVYDENEEYVGDITADALYFTELELRDKILVLFGQDPAKYVTKR